MGEFLDSIRSGIKELFSNKKNLLSLLVLGVMILSLYLFITIKQRQIIQSRAAGDPIVFTGDNVKKRADGTWVATNPKISLQITSPFGPPFTSSSPSPLPSSGTSPSPSPLPSNAPGAGQVAWTRDCKVTPPNITSDCQQWQKAGFGSAAQYGPFKSVSGVFYLDGSTPKVRSLLLNTDGKTLKVADRWITPSYPIGMEIPTYSNGRFGISGEETKTFNDLNEFTYGDSSGNKYVHQTAIESDGTTAWTRDCTITSSGINCPSWTGPAGFGSAAQYGPFKSVSGVFYIEGGTPKVRSLMLNTDGKTLTIATRAVTPTNPIGMTTPEYSTNARFGIPDEANKVFNSLDEFTYVGSDGGTYVHQTAIEVN